MKHTAVTGGGGFIGTHLVRQLLARGESVRVIERPGARIEHLPLGRIDLVFADIRDRVQVRRSLIDCERVYHLAANPQLWTHRKGHFNQVNFLGAVNVLEAAVHAGARHILHTSTESILTRVRQTSPIAEDQNVPLREVIGPYCRSKWRAERFAFRLAQSGAPVLIVNPTLPIGPDDWGRSPPTQMIIDVARGNRAAYLDAELNLIDVRDVAAGMIAAIDIGSPGRRYLLGHENWTIRELFDWVARQENVPRPRWPVPYPVALTAAMISEWWADVFTGRIPAASVTGVRLTRRTMNFDARRSHQELRITPRAIQSSLTDALEWHRAVGWI